MDTKKFGAFVLIAGVVGLGVAGYFYQTVHTESFSHLQTEARQRSAALDDYSHWAEYKIRQEKAEEKALLFASIGGLLAVLGLGLRFSGKEDPQKWEKMAAQAAAQLKSPQDQDA